MSMKKEIDLTYYENHDFGDEFRRAKKNGDLIICMPGENVIEAAKRHMEAKKQTIAAANAKIAAPRRTVAAAVL